MHKSCLLFLIISQPLLSMHSTLAQRTPTLRRRPVPGPPANWWNQPHNPQPTRTSHMPTRALLGITCCTLAYACWNNRQAQETHSENQLESLEKTD